MTERIPTGHVIFWRPWGPLIRYDDGVLYIEDLNPETRMRWAISDMELKEIGIQFLEASNMESE